MNGEPLIPISQNEDVRFLGKMLGEIYRIQRHLEMPNAPDTATVYGLLNGIEAEIDSLSRPQAPDEETGHYKQHQRSGDLGDAFALQATFVAAEQYAFRADFSGTDHRDLPICRQRLAIDPRK